MADLAATELEENEVWDRAETYMLNLVEPGSIYQRLTIWVFTLEYEEDANYIKMQFK